MKINSMLFKTITIYEDVLINLYYLNQLDVYRGFFLYIFLFICQDLLLQLMISTMTWLNWNQWAIQQQGSNSFLIIIKLPFTTLPLHKN